MNPDYVLAQTTAIEAGTLHAGVLSAMMKSAQLSGSYTQALLGQSAARENIPSGRFC
jgi:hypothetical protein